MSSYSERIERYMAAHPGATKAEARGHGSTPEAPGRGRSQERFESYYERRDRAEAHTNQLKQDLYGNSPSFNAEGSQASTERIPIADLELAMEYNSLPDFLDDWGDEVSEDFGHYH